MDDFSANLAAANRLGFRTVLIGSPNPEVPFAPAIRRLVDLPSVIPQNGCKMMKRNEPVSHE